MIKTAGRFDPTDRFIYFRVQGGGKIRVDPMCDARIAADHHRYSLYAVNDLGGEKVEHAQTAINNGAIVLLDSGVYTLTSEYARTHPGITSDDALMLPPEQIDGFDKLFDRYVNLVRRFGDQLWGYVELDQGGLESKRRLRRRLEDMGFNPIPVYHPLHDGWDYFDELAETYDRVCFGNVALADPPERRRLLATAWERHRRYPDLWLHLLGVTPNDAMVGMPADSTDSSSWLSVIRWSGYKEFSLLHTLGHMPRDFQYELGAGDAADNGYGKAITMSAIGCKALQMNWRNHQAALDEHLGLSAYPPAHASERDLVMEEL